MNTAEERDFWNHTATKLADDVVRLTAERDALQTLVTELDAKLVRTETALWALRKEVAEGTGPPSLRRERLFQLEQQVAALTEGLDAVARERDELVSSRVRFIEHAQDLERKLVDASAQGISLMRQIDEYRATVLRLQRKALGLDVKYHQPDLFPDDSGDPT